MGRKRCRGDPLDNTAGRISSGANSPEWTNKSGLPGRDKRWEERRSLQPTRPAANANLCNNQNAIHFPSDDCGARAGLYCLFGWAHKRYALILYSSIVELVHCMCECGAKWAQLRRVMPPCERTDEGLKLGGKEQSKATCCFLYVPKNNSNIGKKNIPDSNRLSLASGRKIRHQHWQIRGPVVLLVKSFQQPKKIPALLLQDHLSVCCYQFVLHVAT